MKKLFLLLFLAIAGVLTWYLFVTKKAPKEEGIRQKPLAVSKHSDSFNLTINNMLASYYLLTESFVQWDTAAVNKHAAGLRANLDQVNLSGLKKDTADAAIYETAATYVNELKSTSEQILKTPDITKKRRTLNDMTDHLYNLLRTIRYDRAKMYRNQCPMAFNDTEAADWLSTTDSIRNPYLGLHHPKYGKGMLKCGNSIDSFNYTE